MSKMLNRTCDNEVKSYILPFSDLPRPVYWFNDTFPGGTWSDWHEHASWGELAYLRRGKMVVCTGERNFLVPPQRAVWIPPGVPHQWYLPEAANDRSLYISPDALPQDVDFSRLRVMHVSPLVRELILSLENMAYPYTLERDFRLVHTFFDQLTLLPEVTSSLPMPANHRLLELCTSLLNAPSTSKTLREWSRELGMSERNLARHFQHETGETFGRWRQLIRLQHAMERLEQGENVTAVALDCGYASTSAFIVAYKRQFGKTPGETLGLLRPSSSAPASAVSSASSSFNRV